MEVLRRLLVALWLELAHWEPEDGVSTVWLLGECSVDGRVCQVVVVCCQCESVSL